MATDLSKYLPEFYSSILEMRELLGAEEPEYDQLAVDCVALQAEAQLSTAGEERLSQWEVMLGIVPQGTLEQRRMMLLAVLMGQGKLDEQRIKQIVGSFTGDLEAVVAIVNSALRVMIHPPDNGEIFIYTDIERALRPLVPAHLGLSVIRYYNTWADRTENYADWSALRAAFTDWAAVSNTIEEES